ncbi:MAG: hypothetical protein EBS05_01455 [Proteobacteria bacterium]|nr:hypothetical protein [Pseudomonadota bacterium]
MTGVLAAVIDSDPTGGCGAGITQTPTMRTRHFGILPLFAALVTVADVQAEPSPAETGYPARVVTEAASVTAKVLRLNFRSVALEQVLDYLGEAAGFIIIPKTEIGGRVTVWCEELLTREEALTVLHSALAHNGLGMIRAGRTLTIVRLDEASRHAMPVRRGGNPEAITPTGDLVTQIIPVKYINAQQLIANLGPLLRTTSGLSANEGANALVLTDTQSSVRRIVEIVKALDTPLLIFSTVKVFALKFADAKLLASVLKDLFAPQDGVRNGSGGAQIQQSFTDGPGGFSGGPGGFGPGAFGNDGNGDIGFRNSGSGRVAKPRVVAAADEPSNTLIVTAPDEQMPLIENLLRQVDVPDRDVAELRVFKLQYAHPEDLAEVLKTLFPDTTSGGGNNWSDPQFPSPFGDSLGVGPNGGNSGPGESGGAAPDAGGRRLKQGRVNVVADLRTSSLLVSATPVLMGQIVGIVTKLDSDPARKLKTFIIPIENSDPAQIQTILKGLFPALNGSGSASRQSTSVNGTATRTTTIPGAQGTGNSGFGSTGGNAGSGANGSGTGGR